MDLNDVSPQKFFKKVTFASDPSPGNKLPIPDGEFIQCAILLKLILSLEKLRSKL